MVGVEQWAEVRRLRFVRGLSIREINSRTGLHRETIRRAMQATRPPGYRRAPGGSKLDRFKDEIHRLLQRGAEVAGPARPRADRAAGLRRGQDDRRRHYARCARCSRRVPRTFQRTVYRPGEVCQFDLWEPRAEVPVGHGQTRRGWVLVACLGYSRAGAGALIFSKQTPDLLFGMARCLWSARGAAARRWSGTARPASTVTAAGRRTSSPPSAASCGSTGTSARRPIRRPRASSSACRTSSSAALSPAGRSRTSSTSRPSSTRGSPSARTSATTRRCAAARSTGWQRNEK